MFLLWNCPLSRLSASHGVGTYIFVTMLLNSMNTEQSVVVLIEGSYPPISPVAQVQTKAAAKKIYDQYLSPSSPYTVNVDDRALKAVESRLANPPPNLFAEAMEQVKHFELCRHVKVALTCTCM